MPNPDLFRSTRGAIAPPVDTVNEAGGLAYKFTNKHALAQYAATGCLSSTFYATAREQLDSVLALCHSLDSEFIAKTALYARHRSFMKDTPALLLAYLCARAGKGDKETSLLIEQIFPPIIDSGKMLRTYIQIMRSGVVGRKSFGNQPKRLINTFFSDHSPDWLLRNSVGQKPSMADILKMTHPKPASLEHDALFAYLLNPKTLKPHATPLLVRFHEWKKNRDDLGLPNLPFQMLTSLELSTKQWEEIAQNGSPLFCLKNLNTFLRHGVSSKVFKEIEEKLQDRQAIKNSKILPYQILAAYLNTENSELRQSTRAALKKMLDYSLENIPQIAGNSIVIIDISGSMMTPLTGRHGRTPPSKVVCLDVAALFATALLKKNPETKIIPVHNHVEGIKPGQDSFLLEPDDTLMTNIKKIKTLPSGATALSKALSFANKKKMRAQSVILISDNQSWADASSFSGLPRNVPSAFKYNWKSSESSTDFVKQWKLFKSRNPSAKLVCVDLQPYSTTQAPDLPNEILNVGGWSDACFTVIAAFLNGSPDFWVDGIEDIML